MAHLSASKIATTMRERIRENLERDPMAKTLLKLAKEVLKIVSFGLKMIFW